MRLGPQATTTSPSGAAATAVPWNPREPSSVAQINVSPSASAHSSAAVRAPWTHDTSIPDARASRAASGIGATPSPPLTSTALRPASSKPRPSGPRQLTRSPSSIPSSWAVPAPTAFSTTSMWSPSAWYTEKGRRNRGPPAQPMLTNCPARTLFAISGASSPRTNIPRAAWRLRAIGASSRNKAFPPLVDGPHLHLVRDRDRRLEQRGRGVERGQAGNPALDRRPAYLEAVLEDRVAIAAVLIDVRHRVDDQLHLTADDHVDDGRSFLADLRHHTRREPGGPQRPRRPVGRDQPAAQLDQARDDRKELRLVSVRDREQGGAAALDVHARGGERLAQRTVQVARDPDRLAGRLHLGPEVG